MHLSAVEIVCVATGTKYNNGSDVQMCLYAKKLVLPEEPIMLDSSMSHQRKMWELRATVTFKNEELRKQN